MNLNAHNLVIKKEHRHALNPRSSVLVKMPAGAIGKIFAVTDENQSVLLDQLDGGPRKTYRYNLQNFIEVAISLKAACHVDVEVRDRQVEEPHDKQPVPEKPVATNILQRLRQTVKTEMASQREHFLENNTGMAGYEIDDEEPERFEDEIIASLPNSGDTDPAAGDDIQDGRPDPKDKVPNTNAGGSDPEQPPKD